MTKAEERRAFLQAQKSSQPIQQATTPATAMTLADKRRMELKQAQQVATQPAVTQPAPTQPIGQYGAGNINLYNRPIVNNPDGTTSTVRSMSFSDGKNEILIPTVVNGKVVSDNEAIDNYYKTGEYLGKFNTVDEANTYAENLHKQQEKLYSHSQKSKQGLQQTQEKIHATEKPMTAKLQSGQALTPEETIRYAQEQGKITSTEANKKLKEIKEPLKNVKIEGKDNSWTVKNDIQEFKDTIDTIGKGTVVFGARAVDALDKVKNYAEWNDTSIINPDNLANYVNGKRDTKSGVAFSMLKQMAQRADRQDDMDLQNLYNAIVEGRFTGNAEDIKNILNKSQIYQNNKQYQTLVQPSLEKYEQRKQQNIEQYPGMASTIMNTGSDILSHGIPTVLGMGVNPTAGLALSGGVTGETKMQQYLAQGKDYTEAAKNIPIETAKGLAFGKILEVASPILSAGITPDTSTLARIGLGFSTGLGVGAVAGGTTQLLDLLKDDPDYDYIDWNKVQKGINEGKYKTLEDYTGSKEFVEDVAKSRKKQILISAIATAVFNGANQGMTKPQTTALTKKTETDMLTRAKADKYLKTLGLKEGATQEQVKSAFRSLSKQYHPDVNPGDDEPFKAIAEAYNALTKNPQYAFVFGEGVTPTATTINTTQTAPTTAGVTNTNSLVTQQPNAASATYTANLAPNINAGAAAISQAGTIANVTQGGVLTAQDVIKAKSVYEIPALFDTHPVNSKQMDDLILDLVDRAVELGKQATPYGLKYNAGDITPSEQAEWDKITAEINEINEKIKFINRVIVPNDSQTLNQPMQQSNADIQQYKGASLNVPLEYKENTKKTITISQPTLENSQLDIAKKTYVDYNNIERNISDVVLKAIEADTNKSKYLKYNHTEDFYTTFNSEQMDKIFVQMHEQALEDVYDGDNVGSIESDGYRIDYDIYNENWISANKVTDIRGDIEDVNTVKGKNNTNVVGQENGGQQYSNNNFLPKDTRITESNVGINSEQPSNVQPSNKNDSQKNIQQLENSEQSSFSMPENNEMSTQQKIYSSMTQEDAKDMIQRAFISNGIKSWYDDKYKNGDEWLAGEGAEEVANYIENTESTVSKYLNRLYDEHEADGFGDEYDISDILEAYKNKQLTGPIKQEFERINTSTSTGYQGNKFYEPKNIQLTQDLYNKANQRVTNKNRDEVYKARADFIIAAHQKGSAEQLGLTQKELNTKLKTWANYPAKTLKLSQELNEGVAKENQWTGLENCSIVNSISISNEDMEKMVKQVIGDSDEWQRQYITRTMLALDTHIDYSDLTYDFEQGAALAAAHAGGDYNYENNVIRIGQGYLNTVAHETGHYLDYQWGREIFGKNSNISYWARGHSEEVSKLNGEQQKFVKHLAEFLDDIEKSSELGDTLDYQSTKGSGYWQRDTEVFARFVAKFTEWTNNQATNNRYGYEDTWYHDRFTESQYKEFVKILQEKSALDIQSQSPNAISKKQSNILPSNEELLTTNNKEMLPTNEELKKVDKKELLPTTDELQQFEQGKKQAEIEAVRKGAKALGLEKEPAPPVEPPKPPTEPPTEPEEIPDYPDDKIAQLLKEKPQRAKMTKKEMAENAYKTLVNKGYYVDKLAEESGNPQLKYKYDRMLASANEGNYVVGEKQTDNEGNIIGKSVNEIWKPVEEAGKVEEFSDYLLHKLNINRMSLEDIDAITKADTDLTEFIKNNPEIGGLSPNKLKKLAKGDDENAEKARQLIELDKQAEILENRKNKPVFGETVTADDSRKIVAEYEKNNPEFVEWAKDINTFNKNQLQNMVDAGLASEETQQLLNDMYDNYIRIQREVGGDRPIVNQRGRLKVNSPIKKAKGGNQDILPLKDSMAQQAVEVKKAISRNLFGQELLNTIGGGEEVEDYGEILNKGKNGEAPTFTVFKDGNPVTMKINNELYDAIKPSDRTSLSDNVITNGLRKAVVLQKTLLTSRNPLFALTNFARDLQTAIVNSKDTPKMLNNYRKLVQYKFADLFSKQTGKELSLENQELERLWELYKANGGESNTYFDFEKGTSLESKNPVKRTVDKVTDRIFGVNEIVEQMPRVAEFITTLENGGTIDEAMYNAADITVNFKRGGELTKALDRNGASFLNASVQGLDKQIRNITDAFKSKNKGKAFAKLILTTAMLGIAPQVLNHLLLHDDEDYQDLPDYIKDGYWLIKTGDDSFIRIPRGRDIPTFLGNIAQRTTRAIEGDEHAFDGLVSSFSNTLAPNNPVEDNVVAPFVAVSTNKAWNGSQIESASLQNQVPSQRYDAKDTEFAKWLAATELGEKFGWSPKKIDYLLDQYSGGVGDILIPLNTKYAEGKNPLSAKFTTDSVTSNKQVNLFYDTKNELSQRKTSGLTTDAENFETQYLNNVANRISGLNNMKSSVQMSDISDKDKIEQTRELQKQIIQETRTANNNYKKLGETYDKYVADDAFADFVLKNVEDKSDAEKEAIVSDSAKLYSYKDVLGADYAVDKLPLSDKMQEKYENSGIDADIFFEAYMAQKGETSKKDANGNTIKLSEATNKKNAIDDAVGDDLSKQELEQLYGIFNISEKVW